MMESSDRSNVFCLKYFNICVVVKPKGRPFVTSEDSVSTAAGITPSYTLCLDPLLTAPRTSRRFPCDFPSQRSTLATMLYINI